MIGARSSPAIPTWPRAAAGLLYGFSPFVVAHSSVGHLNLVWAVLPPALLWLLHALLVAPRPPPWRTGVLIGLGAATKLYPFFLLGPILVVAWRRKG